MGMKTYTDYNALKHTLRHIPDKEHQGFLCLTYATLGRVGEVLRHPYDSPTQDPKKWINPPIKAEDIKLEKLPNGTTYLSVLVLTEKVRQTRKVIINHNKEAWLVNPFWRKKKEIKTGYMYNYSTRWGELVFKKYFGTQNIHLLRHWRITHLLNGSVTGKPQPPQIVARLAGHTSLKTQATYDHSIVEDYANEFLGNQTEVTNHES